MTDQEMSQIAMKVVNDSKFWIGLVGVIGAIIGSILTLIGNFALEWLKGRAQKKIDSAREKILEEMLKDSRFQWRNLSTLAAVIGCSEKTTKNHLIAIGARGSEKNDGKWGLIARNPLSKISQEA